VSSLASNLRFTNSNILQRTLNVIGNFLVGGGD
jgi:hypothetical protein